MRSNLIDNRLMYVYQLLLDLKEVSRDISSTSDPALIYEYEEEFKVLIDDLNDHEQDLMFVLEAYLQDCKDSKIPILLEYYKIYKELSNERRFRLRYLE